MKKKKFVNSFRFDEIFFHFLRVTSVGVSLPPPIAKEKPPINVVGDVSGRIAIMVDDLIDDVQSFVDAAAVLKERGAYKIYVMATHGILSKEAPRLIEDSAIDEVSHFLRENSIFL